MMNMVVIIINIKLRQLEPRRVGDLIKNKINWPTGTFQHQSHKLCVNRDGPEEVYWWLISTIQCETAGGDVTLIHSFWECASLPYWGRLQCHTYHTKQIPVSCERRSHVKEESRILIKIDSQTGLWFLLGAPPHLAVCLDIDMMIEQR